MPFATINDHVLHYADSATEQSNGKPPIVMVHGLGSSQNFYMPVIAKLQGYRCVAMDTYGAGRSRSKGEELTLAQLAEDVVGLMDHLGIPKAVIAGHSMGGTMVCTVAAAHPTRVAGIVAIGPVNAKSVPLQAFRSRIDTVTKDGMEPLATSIPVSATGSRSTPLHRAFIRELLLSQEPKGYASHCGAILGMQEPQGGFEAVKCPAVILAGEDDKSAPLEGCQYIRTHLGSSRKDLKILQGVGHWHCVEAGDEVAQEIDAFCASL
ncbi:hypothetical protein KC343_g9488 [Hortaea werneckii]|nr:hypothetical protein KC352_g13564 [Hortaea werneckii]KAI7570046.1 hypothetical protein KC317_g2804 [Hortaea werneckii]KAI7617361.1 hypothetical protein KC343_g9488 [Hortaea werneckii]KAI7622210.1 hypothetical protein KC346_g3311 [Hortaea werneckii]KAI7650225.1 hypothetical protein KC319_g11100 [Hortaea werneckii]